MNEINELEQLKNWLNDQIKYCCKDNHNESTYLWGKGFRKACIKVLEKIDKIEKQRNEE